MAFQVVVVPTAQRDLEEIVSWVAERSPAGAARLLSEFNRLLSALARGPHEHGLAPECQEIGRQVRQALFKTRHGGTYRALFDVHENEVRVLRVRGPGQAPLSDEEI